MISVLLYAAVIGHSLTISPVAVTLHGILNVDDTVRDAMPYKLSEDGTWTFHPALGFLYRHKNFQGAAVYFKDSFGKNAGTLMAGPVWTYFSHLHLGAAAGLYVRETTNKVDKFPGSIRNSVVEIVPTVVANAYVDIPIMKNISIEAGANSNYVVTFFIGGLKINFK